MLHILWRRDRNLAETRDYKYMWSSAGPPRQFSVVTKLSFRLDKGSRMPVATFTVIISEIIFG